MFKRVVDVRVEGLGVRAQSGTATFQSVSSVQGSNVWPADASGELANCSASLGLADWVVVYNPDTATAYWQAGVSGSYQIVGSTTDLDSVKLNLTLTLTNDSGGSFTSLDVYLAKNVAEDTTVSPPILNVSYYFLGSASGFTIANGEQFKLSIDAWLTSTTVSISGFTNNVQFRGGPLFTEMIRRVAGVRAGTTPVCLDTVEVLRSDGTVIASQSVAGSLTGSTVRYSFDVFPSVDEQMASVKLRFNDPVARPENAVYAVVDASGNAATETLTAGVRNRFVFDVQF